MAREGVSLGLGANWRQFALLVAVNAFVGAMVGLERSILPLIGEREFGLESSFAIVSFIVAFGLAKAISNLVAGRLSDVTSRRTVLLAGWLIAIPVPFLLIWAPSWGWVNFANVLLGINQGLTWSMTVNMKIDLVGPAKRGLALGFNEGAGYLAVAAAAFATGLIAESYGLRPEPLYLGIGFVAAGLALSALFVRDTGAYVAEEARDHQTSAQPSLRRAFGKSTWGDRRLFGANQAGFFNNLNDALAWGIFPLYFASKGLSLEEVAILAAVYPLVWACLQPGTGWASDSIGRKKLIVSGMLIQACAIAGVVLVSGFQSWLIALIVLGVGTALVYPTLLAVIADAAHPVERATFMGVYRFWRDIGAAVGALAAGAMADALGLDYAIIFVAALTATSGFIAWGTLQRGAATPPTPAVGG
ncbi:MAG: MFS transporter [Chloroflexi bacterium]|nr:MFS transporter [Chloroflexota bacterium]